MLNPFIKLLSLQLNPSTKKHEHSSLTTNDLTPLLQKQNHPRIKIKNKTHQPQEKKGIYDILIFNNPNFGSTLFAFILFLLRDPELFNQKSMLIQA